MQINRGAFLLLSILICHPLRATLPDHTLSPSRQFVVYGANATLRGNVSQVAEQTKATLLAVLREPDRWKTSIVVNVQLPQANLPELPPAELRFSQTGFGLKLQLDLTLAPNADASLVERELLRAILLEMIYRREMGVAPGTAYVEPPDWLLDGVLALTPGRDRQPLVDALALSGKALSFEDFFRQRPASIDSPGRLLYRACSFAFVQLLVDEADGPARLARYIDNLSLASSDPLADLKAQFPLLRGNAKEVWRSNIIRRAAVQKYQLLTVAETEDRLVEILRLKIADASGPAKTAELGDLLQRKISPTEKSALTRLSQELLSLGVRANPVMRPVMREYQQITALLVSGKRRKVAQRLRRLTITRTELVARMSDIDDYLNWFEATQSKTKSQMFGDYLDAASESRASSPRRRDALSVYLDSLEAQF
ncbi:MAG: hypothetical protein ABI925_03480 [Verrucomicrobiota bacterium]